MPSPEQRKRIRTPSEVVFVPYFFVRVNYSRCAEYGQSQWQSDHWKARDPKRGATTSTTPLKSDGKTMTNIVPPKLFIAGQESVGGILTLSQQSTCPTWQPGNPDPDTKNSLVLGVNGGPQPGSTGGRAVPCILSSQTCSSPT